MNLKELSIKELAFRREKLQEIRSANYEVLARQERMISELKIQLFLSMVKINEINDEIYKREKEQNTK